MELRGGRCGLRVGGGVIESISKSCTELREVCLVEEAQLLSLVHDVSKQPTPSHYRMKYQDQMRRCPPTGMGVRKREGERRKEERREREREGREEREGEGREERERGRERGREERERGRGGRERKRREIGEGERGGRERSVINCLLHPCTLN